MRKYIFLTICGLICSFYGCANTTKDIRFIKHFYEQYVFGNEPFVPNGKNMCSTEMLNYLLSQYEYDCNDGECYAIWCFRTGQQDGSSNESKVVKVKYVKDNVYTVSYIDMGHKGSTTIQLTDKNGERLINKIIEP